MPFHTQAAQWEMPVSLASVSGSDIKLSLKGQFWESTFQKLYMQM